MLGKNTYKMTRRKPSELMIGFSVRVRPRTYRKLSKLKSSLKQNSFDDLMNLLVERFGE